MAERLGISRQQVQYDIRMLRERYRQTALRAVKRHTKCQLTKLDHLETCAWEKYEASCQPAEISTSSIVKGRVNKNGSPLPDLTKAQKVVKGQIAGDVRYLDVVMRCIEQRCKILGIGAPTKVGLTDPSGEKELTISDEERISLVTAFVNRISEQARAGGAGSNEPGQGAGDRPLPA
jgi:hypothetical protein